MAPLLGRNLPEPVLPGMVNVEFSKSTAEMNTFYNLVQKTILVSVADLSLHNNCTGVNFDTSNPFKLC